MTTILGIDPSLSHTALHTLECADWDDARLSSGSIVTSPKQFAHPVARLDAIGARFLTLIAGIDPGVAYVEGYAFGAKQNREALGELGGVIRLALYTNDWRMCIVPPTTLKKFVTGKGVAEKEQMMLQIYKHWGYEPSDNNDADAFALLQLGLVHQGIERGTKAQLEALQKLEVWGAR